MAAAPDLHLLVCRATLRATRALFFEPPAANRFRGALGLNLPAHLFCPAGPAGPSGLRDRPRPFVLRCAHLDGRRIPAGQSFHLDLHLFTAQSDPFQDALSRLGWAEPQNWSRQELLLSFQPVPVPVSALRVEFLSPTELKPPIPPGQLPPFALLFARLRDRLSALHSFYGAGPLDLDYRALGQRAAAVVTSAGHLDWIAAERTSRRTGQTHPLSGFTGSVDYSGPLAEFLPWLQAGFYTGVGRQTVWGKGVIRPVTL